MSVLSLKSVESSVFDILSLGEVMLRLDPGDGGLLKYASSQRFKRISLPQTQIKWMDMPSLPIQQTTNI